MLRLRFATPEAWKHAVLADTMTFLRDHAHNERKVAGAALLLATHHPQRSSLVTAMIELAQEELTHFGQVHDWIVKLGGDLGRDTPDAYMGAVHKLLRRGDTETYLLDRLLAFGIVESRGCERFRMAAEALSPGPLGDFYWELVRSEARHHQLFIAMAREFFGEAVVVPRLDALLELEAEIAAQLPIRAALH
jgi:tRNA 2-(methylsulfanyl)-N6-isopentenyladenosine37 hydroxylase